MRAEPSPSRDACRPWLTVSGRLLVFERKQDGAIDRNRETTMSPSEHDKTNNKLRQWTERARQGVIGLEFSFLMAFVRIDAMLKSLRMELQDLSPHHHTRKPIQTLQRVINNTKRAQKIWVYEC